jgi:hypothetical protein
MLEEGLNNPDAKQHGSDVARVFTQVQSFIKNMLQDAYISDMRAVDTWKAFFTALDKAKHSSDTLTRNVRGKPAYESRVMAGLKRILTAYGVLDSRRVTTYSELLSQIKHKRDSQEP